MMKLRFLTNQILVVKEWIDVHLSWFFTNGNKVQHSASDEPSSSFQDDQAI